MSHYGGVIYKYDCPHGFAHDGPCEIDGKCVHKGWCHLCHKDHGGQTVAVMFDKHGDRV